MKKVISSAVVLVTLLGFSSEAFRVLPATRARPNVKLSMSSGDYLSALSKPAQAPAAATPPPSAPAAPLGHATAPPPVSPPSLPTDDGYRYISPLNAKAGPFDSITPKTPVLQGGQVPEFQAPSDPQATTSFRFPHDSSAPNVPSLYQPGAKAGPFDTMTPKDPVWQGGQTAEFQAPSNQAPPEVGGYLNSLSKAGPFDSMTPKDPVWQGGQTAEFQAPSNQAPPEVGGYSNSVSKAGPFDSMTPKASVMQGGQTAEFRSPSEEGFHEVGGYQNPSPQAGPFDTMTPKNPVVQGGQITEFKDPGTVEPATSVRFPHSTNAQS